MIRVVSYDEYKKLLDEIITERGDDFRYILKDGLVSACNYQLMQCPTGTMSRCLIGESLHRLGATEDELVAFDDREAGSVNAIDVLRRLGFDERTRKFAQVVQNRQDAGDTWREAFNYGVYQIEV